MMDSETERSLLEYVRKSSPPPFLLKTYMLVEDPASDEVISWNTDGTAFVVWQPAEFARDLLPTLFKHSNFSSFVRQLNTYQKTIPCSAIYDSGNDNNKNYSTDAPKGFRKVATTRWEFSNEKFRKGAKDQLCEIRRRKAWNNKSQTKAQNKAAPKEPEEDQRSSSTSSSSEYTILIDENKRLKKENGFLSSELSTMKKKCKELLDLVAVYASSEKEDDLDERPKLFGVRLEVQAEIERKRKIAEISQNASLFLFQSCK